MATPNFNKELLKLRRRLGDIFTEDYTEITVANVGSLDGNVWRANNLIDIYNDAVRDFLDYVVTSVPKDSWYAYLPGYIRHWAQDITPGGQYNFSQGLVDPVDGTVVPVLFVVSLYYTKDTDHPQEFVYISPDEYLPTKFNKFPKRRPSEDSLFYTVINYGIYPIPEVAYDPCEIVFIKQHTDVVADSNTDLWGFPGEALRKVLDYAEAEAIKQKQAVGPEIVKALLQERIKSLATTIKVTT